VHRNLHSMIPRRVATFNEKRCSLGSMAQYMVIATLGGPQPANGNLSACPRIYGIAAKSLTSTAARLNLLYMSCRTVVNGV
jgi:hypothetical protein